MKYVIKIILCSSCLFSFSQVYQVTKEELLVSIYENNTKQTINYDKSFVSDDRLYYESLTGVKPHVPSEEELVKEVLQKYMKGSSYNKLDLLESAFADNATLYLTNRDGIFKRYTPKEYSEFFKNGEYGTFNGREAKVLAIEVIKDIATAKVEIAGPDRKWVYIDLFLLKKFEDGWKIISKTATRVDENSGN